MDSERIMDVHDHQDSSMYFLNEDLEDAYLDRIKGDMTSAQWMELFLTSSLAPKAYREALEKGEFLDSRGLWQEDNESRYKLVYLGGIPGEDSILIGALDIQENCPCGILSLSADSMILNIEYIYVPLEYRGESIGSLMFEGVKQMAFMAPVPMDIECLFDMDDDTLFNFFYDRPDIDMVALSDPSGFCLARWNFDRLQYEAS